MIAVCMATSLHAQLVTTTDGQTYSTPSLRKSGEMIMVKISLEGGSGSVEMGIPITRIAKVAFPEPPELSKVIAYAAKGNAAQVLALTAEFVSTQGDLKAVPGSWWPEMARFRILALAASGKDSECSELARQIGAVKSPASESLSRAGTLFSPLFSGDYSAVLVGAKALPGLGGDQGSALAQLALGRALLGKKDFPGALRAFLTISVFYPSVSLLQGPALAGAAESYTGLKDMKRSAQCYADIIKEWPDCPQYTEAKKKAELSAQP
jgi:hypothetical protein